MGNTVADAISTKLNSKHSRHFSSGFRCNADLSLLSSLQSMQTLKDNEIDDILSDIDELTKLESDDSKEDTTSELLHIIHEFATKHGIMNGKFEYIKKENILSHISIKFTYIKQLGDGASSRVLLVHQNRTNTKYALKELICNDEYNAELFKKEIHLLTQLNHPNILKYYDSYIDPHNFYIATEYCYGGDLYQRCKEYKTFSERIASQIIFTIIDAVNYMHKKGVVHRDLKPGNIVFDKPGPDGTLFIIDFGDSAIVEDDGMYNEFVGTIHYLPPEITRYRHGWELKKGDIWSIGVITYQLLCGRYPFNGNNNEEIISKIKKCRYGLPKNIVLSKYAKEFMRYLLKKNVHARWSAADALKNEWFKKANDKYLGDIFSETMDNVARVAHLRYILKNKLAYELEEDEKMLIMNTFKEIDMNHKGYIDQSQIESFLIKLNIKDKYAKVKASQIMKTFDKDNIGRITLADLVENGG